MAEHGEFVPNVIFGLNPMWVAVTVLVLTYAVIMSEKVNRSIVALLGAGLHDRLGVLTQEQAIEGDGLQHASALLVGMMVLVADLPEKRHVRVSGGLVGQEGQGRALGASWRCCRWSTAVVSAFLDNVTTVLLIAPVTLVITES